MRFQLLACLACVQLLAACKPQAIREIQSRVSASLHNLEHFFTLSHTLPLYDSLLNIGLLIAKIQANLARNKANKMVDKIQPYSTTFEAEQYLRSNFECYLPSPLYCFLISTSLSKVVSMLSFISFILLLK